MSLRSPVAAPKAAAGPKSWIADFIVLASLWGASFLFMRIATLEFGPLPTAAVRVTIAMLFFAAAGLAAWCAFIATLRPPH